MKDARQSETVKEWKESGDQPRKWKHPRASASESVLIATNGESSGQSTAPVDL